MRLSERKIDDLGEKICQALVQSQFCILERARGPVLEVIKRVILEDLKMEDDLDAEVERILDDHKDQIRLRGADYHTMFKKTKNLLAKERKFIY